MITPSIQSIDPTENVSPLKYWWAKATKGGLGVDADALTAQGPRSDRIRKAYTFHVVQSGRCVRACVDGLALWLRDGVDSWCLSVSWG